jgi:glycosyltransferase involved in cell wall biosynthesis
MVKKNVIVSVTNDLATDARVEKVCLLLTELNYHVLLVGRKLPNSLPIQAKPYTTKRFKLLFNKGPLFYAEYNLRLFFFLLFQPKAVLVANDLDTLLPNTIISRWKNTPLVYDSHEYYTGVPELEGRPRVQKIWKRIERCCIPKLKFCITVNQSIANLYKEEYGVDFKVVRNVPVINSIQHKTLAELGLPADKKIIILQGAGININRGAEELLQSMQYLEGYLLLIIGGGDVFEKLKTMRVDLGLQEKVLIMDKMPRDKMLSYTAAAHLGATLDKPLSTNYLLSLPNKIFDYVMAGIPVLSSDLIELKAIIEKYDIGVVTPSHNPEDIATAIQNVLRNEEMYSRLKANTAKALTELNWENEKKVLVDIYTQLVD